MCEAVSLTVTYADIFDYPLTIDEIHRYLAGRAASRQAVLEAVTRSGLFSQVGEYFTFPGREPLVLTRQRRAQAARRLWRAAAFYGRLIGHFPFVYMAAVTGALAVDNVEAGADIDFLIVTAPSHLWVCRGMVLLLARLARLHGVRLCPNYLVTTRALAFPDHNFYAAHEIVQMVPLSGLEIYAEIRRQNQWTESYLPNAVGAPPAPIPIQPPNLAHPLRRLGESLLRTSPGRALEQWEMKRKIIQLAREQAGSPESDFSADYCKGHSQRHQEHTRSAWRDRAQVLLWELEA